MRKKLSLISLVVPLMVSGISYAADQIPGAQATDAMNFDTIGSAKTSISQKMVLFEMPPEYECPVFSNSPYNEILSSLDKMQENLNSTFPQCDSKAQNEKVSQKAVELRNSVFEAKKLQDSGQTFKLELSAQKMVDAAQKIQEALAVAAQSQTKICYRSNQQFRSTVFSINETFQGIAPVVLDIVSKNPALGGKLGPAMKILAGADSLSKGLNFVEQIARDSVMFDMTDKENRVNTLKNVCQYMKLYRRLEYMRMLKLGQIQSVYSQFQKRITNINQNINEFRKKSSMTTTNGAAAMPMTADAAQAAEAVVQEPNYLLFTSLKTLLPEELKKLQKAQFDLEQAATDLKRPKVAQCQIIETAKSSIPLRKTVEKLFKFSEDWGMGNAPDAADALDALNRQLTAYDGYFASAKEKQNLDECVDLGQDWIKITLELLSHGQQMVHLFGQELADMYDKEDQIKVKRISKKEREKQNEQTNLASLKSMMQYAAFESSEVEKRAKDMHRYFFRGPEYNEIKAACDKGENCGYEWVASGIKAAYQWKRNNGPIYELLYNNELHFTNAYSQMMRAMGVFARYEFGFAKQEFASLPKNQKTFSAQINTEWKYYTELKHLSLDHLTKGSPLHRNLCLEAKQVLDKYLIASTHMMSSQSLCDMVYPALKEENVASKLRDYCIPTMLAGGKMERASSLQELIFKMVGRGRNCPMNTGPRDPNAPPDDFKYSPKALVDKLIEKYDNLECEQTSGF